MLADAMEKVGKDGVITVDEGKSLKTEVEWVEGMQFDRGYLSPYFVTDPHDDGRACSKTPTSSSTRRRSRNVKDLVPVLEAVVNAGKPLLIVAEDVEGEALATLVINKLRGTFNVRAVKAPGYGDRRKAMLEDIAILTGGQADLRRPRHQAREPRRSTDLGRAKKVIVDKDNTTIIEGAGKSGDIKARIDQIRREIDNTTSDYDREKLEERLAKLVRRRGQGQRRRRDRKRNEGKEGPRRRRPARHACGRRRRHSARRRRRPAACLGQRQAGKASTHDEEVGYNIVVRACRAPLTAIADNAGQDGGVVCEKVLEAQGQRRLQRRDRRLRRPGQGRRHRPDQGHPHRPAKRRQRRDAAADQRRPDRRSPKKDKKGGGGHGRRHG